MYENEVGLQLAEDSLFLQRLAELLKSKKPEDLQEANRLIKNMVKEVRHLRFHAAFDTLLYTSFRF